MAAAKYAMTTPPADRVKVVVLGMPLGAEPGVGVPTTRASLTVAAAGVLGLAGFSVSYGNHFFLLASVLSIGE